MQVQDFALARKKIVVDVEAIHRLEMAAEDGGRDKFCNRGSFAGGIFDAVQRLRADLQVLLVLRVPLRNAGIQIPAVVIETRLAGEGLYLAAGLLLNMQKSHDDVRNLHTSVVDVVLNVHFPARATQQSDKRVSENGITEVADVGGLV